MHLPLNSGRSSNSFHPTMAPGWLSQHTQCILQVPSRHTFLGGWGGWDLIFPVSPTSSQVQKAEARIKLQDLPGQPRPHKDGVATQFNYSDLLWGVGPDSSYLNGMEAYFPFLLLC